jgi:DNA helicase II / ATP-dependent DNA helicase PcrA
MNPTDEQSAILHLARSTNDNLMINALAGTGKTTTLEMIEGAVDVRPILYLAFNRKIADDATKRMASTTTVRTFNSLGHRIWAKSIAKQFKPDSRKVPDLLRLAITEEKSRSTKQLLWDNFWAIVNGVNTARGIGYIPRGHAYHAKSLATEADLQEACDEVPDDFVFKQINLLLLRSIAAAYSGLCDFNDQIYMPTLFAGIFPEFPLVMVDEYQDLNPVNHAMVRKLVRHRLIGVGDPYQSIYEFRGAVPAGMREAVKTFAMTECDLSISFRCPEAIVRSVHWHVPKFRWIKPGGQVAEIRKLTELPEEATFICRNNAPLFKLALRVLAAGRSVSVAGSDIGPRLISQMKKLGPLDMKQTDVIAAVDSWLEARLAKGSKSAQDTAECMRVFAGAAPTLSAALAYAEHLFAQRGSLTFTTGHKAKGLEWPTVYHLDSWLLNATEQDKNLAYVIATRSADRLFEVSSADVKL